jgi:hypothetical protein
MSYTLRFKEPFVKGEQYYNETYNKVNESKTKIQL